MNAVKIDRATLLEWAEGNRRDAARKRQQAEWLLFEAREAERRADACERDAAEDES